MSSQPQPQPPTTTMIVAQPKINIIQSGIKGAVSFGIKNEGLAHIFNVLRNQLYSDKILAVLREYSCNAVDAHTEAGHPEKPIQVTLPTSISPSLKIRDFGLGLSDQDIKEIYAFYGESTKRNSNSLIGQLGLGSKSAFAYGDNFVINSHCNGTLSTYNAFIDESQVGQIAKLVSKPTSEPNGVEIVIPVRSQDINEFSRKATRLFGFFKVKPTILGAKIDFQNDDIALSGSNWMFVKNNKDATAVMGNIGYEINVDALKLDIAKDNTSDVFIRKALERSYYGLMSNMALQLELPIGAVDIAASRESLQYTERTIKAIKDAVLNVQREMIEKVETICAEADSEYKAKVILGDIRSNQSPYSLLAFNNNNVLKYKRKAIDPSLAFSKEESESFKLYEQRIGYINNSRQVKGGKTKDIFNNHLQVSSGIVLVENTKLRVGGIVNRIMPYLKQDKKVLILNFKNPTHRQTFMQTNGIADSDLIGMETLAVEKLPTSRPATGSTGGLNPTRLAKHAESVFQFKPTSSYSRAKSDNWMPVSFVNDDQNVSEFAWVKIHKFLAINEAGRELDTHYITQIESAIKKIVADNKLNESDFQFPKIIGVKAELVDKFKSGKVKHFSTFVRELLTKLDKACGFSQDRRIYNALCKLSGFSRVLSQLVTTNKQIQNSILPNLKKISDNLENQNKMVEARNIKKINDYLKIAEETWGIKDYQVPANEGASKVQKQVASLIKTLPLFQFVDIYQYRDFDKSQMDGMTDYIKLKDKDLRA